MGTPNLDLTMIQQSQANKEVTANTAFTILDTFAGVSTIAILAGTNTLSEAQCQAGVIVLTGSLTGNATVVIPATLAKASLVINTCSGGYTVSVGVGTNSAVPALVNAPAWIYPGGISGFGFGQQPQLTSIAVTGGTTGVTDIEASCRILQFSGVLTANQVVQLPAVVREWTIFNGTSGAYTLTLEAVGSGAGILLGQGKRAMFYCDGTSIQRVSPDT